MRSRRLARAMHACSGKCPCSIFPRTPNACKAQVSRPLVQCFFGPVGFALERRAVTENIVGDKLNKNKSNNKSKLDRFEQA